jgi:hypothetical protein
VLENFDALYRRMVLRTGVRSGRNESLIILDNAGLEHILCNKLLKNAFLVSAPTYWQRSVSVNYAW